MKKWKIFINHIIKFIVQDQISDAVNRMDQNRIRSTEIDETSEDYNPKSWQKVEDADPETGLKLSMSVKTKIKKIQIFNPGSWNRSLHHGFGHWMAKLLPYFRNLERILFVCQARDHTKFVLQT